MSSLPNLLGCSIEQKVLSNFCGHWVCQPWHNEVIISFPSPVFRICCFWSRDFACEMSILPSTAEVHKNILRPLKIIMAMKFMICDKMRSIRNGRDRRISVESRDIFRGKRLWGHTVFGHGERSAQEGLGFKKTKPRLGSALRWSSTVFVKTDDGGGTAPRALTCWRVEDVDEEMAARVNSSDALVDGDMPVVVIWDKA